MIENEKVVTATYELYVADETNPQEEKYETATAEKPLVYCHGVGMMLPSFEAQMAGKKAGDSFDFVLKKEEAYGEYDESILKQLPREMFYNGDGEFDEERVFAGNIIPMQTQEGQIVNVCVNDVDDKTVTIDLNHPLAGFDLHFVGKILDVRDATAQELEQIKHPHKCCKGAKGQCKKVDGECCGHHGEHGEHGDGECCGKGGCCE